MDQQAYGHTGPELELMLAGVKPMAMFYAAADELPHEEFVPEEAFAPYVSAKLMSRRATQVSTVTPGGAPTILSYVFFALVGEEWRMPAMELLVRALHTGGGWNETCQRVEGALLGYTQEEIDEYCRARFKTPAS